MKKHIGKAAMLGFTALLSGMILFGKAPGDQSFSFLAEAAEAGVDQGSGSGKEIQFPPEDYLSNLPVLYINTEGSQDIVSKENYLSATLKILSEPSSETPLYDGDLQIKGRGNSSFLWAKKSFRLKLGKKSDLFGMGSNKNWVLISSYMDQCMLRNKTAYDMAKEMGLESMDCVWVDVVLNGEYYGNYLLCEQIRVDENRINIFDWESEAEDVSKAIVKAEKKKGNELDKDALKDAMKEDLSWITTGVIEFEGNAYDTGALYEDISGGYLFELSDEYDEVSRFQTESGLKIMLKSPEYLNTNPEMMDRVETFWNLYEQALRSEDGYVMTNEGLKHYSELADLDSMVAFWLINEIMGNDDSYYKSRYAYMDMNSKLKFGPVWDFDWGADSVLANHNPTGWRISKNSSPQCFFKEFVDDPLFIAKATEQYWQIRPYLESLICSGGILDQNAAYLSSSGTADGARWDRSERWGHLGRSYEEDSVIFREFMRARVAWLDEQFASDRVLLASVRSNNSAAPYVRVSDELTLSVPEAAYDVISRHAEADGIVKTGQDATLNMQLLYSGTTVLEVYVNGVLQGKAPVSASNNASLTIPAASLTYPAGKKNVISVIGKNAAGNTTYRNFYTLIRQDQSINITELQKNVSVNGSIALDGTYTWTSSDPGVASIAGSHAVGLKAGKTVLIGRSGRGVIRIELTVSFRDVPLTSELYYKDAVYWAVEHEITAGVVNNESGLYETFLPDRVCTRSQMIAFLWRMAGCPEPKNTTMIFTDVPEGTYYYKAVLWGYENSIVGGYSDKTFHPDDACTRAHAVTFLWRYYGCPAPAQTAAFTDLKNKNLYYYNAVLWASQKGITGGYADNTFRAENTCTRGQMVSFLYRSRTISRS
ncbi:MAG: CotH kinase family protein [Lachnospiraceae bacterium]|nr:CotH kinase family protein [Lachnospiraceae bacterium]